MQHGLMNLCLVVRSSRTVSPYTHLLAVSKRQEWCIIQPHIIPELGRGAFHVNKGTTERYSKPEPRFD